ncbi:MAG: hypothetical protein NT013_23700 [Planctomycetia bacterium]|nr:hypothetical protein [Planctomycetia bacterium]
MLRDCWTSRASGQTMQRWYVAVIAPRDEPNDQAALMKRSARHAER